MRILHPLRIRSVLLLWCGLALSEIGDQLYAVALAWVGVDVLGSRAGYLSALQALILLLAVLGAGRWTDRWDRGRSMVGADLARAAVLAVVAASWIAGGRPSVAGLVVAIAVLAAGEAVFDPALQTFLPFLVEDARLLPGANGLLDATGRSARLLGPGLVALLAGIVPVVHFLTLDAATFVCSAVALLLIGRGRHGRPAVRSGRESALASCLRGVRAMRAHPLLAYALTTAGLLNGAWYSAFFLGLPLLIQGRHVTGLGGSSLGAYGLVISAYGCTNLLATLVVGSRGLSPRPHLQMYVGTLLVGGGMVLLAAASLLPRAGILPGLMACAALGAVGGPMKDIPLAVLRQTCVPREDLAAAMRASMAASTAGTLVALLLAPLALAGAGVPPVLAACGAIVVLIGIVGLARYATWTERSAAFAP